MGDVADWQSLNSGGFRWRIRPGVPGDLADRLLEPWTEDGGDLDVVKRNPSRAVFRLRFEGETVYVKWHRFRGIGDALVSLLRGSRALREWKAARAIERCGIATPEPILIGLRRWFGVPIESFLATREVGGGSLKQLAPALAASRDRADIRRRHRLTRALGELVRRLHACGVSHPDLHTDNFLVTESGDGLCLLDLHAAGVCGSVSRRRRVRNLAVLGNAFGISGVTRTDRLRFARAYLGPEWSRPAVRRLAKAVRARSTRLRERRIRSRSRRCVVESSVYTNAHTSKGRVYRTRAISLDQVWRAVTLHHDVMAGRSDGTVLKRDAKTNVTLVPWDGSLQAGELCVKEFVRAGSLMRLLPRCLRYRPAMRSWRASLGLTVRGVGAPEALALIMGKGARSYVVMRAVTSADLADAYVRRVMIPGFPTARRRAFVVAAAGFLLECYAVGVEHRDLKARNILVRETPAGAWEFFLLDLDAVRFPRRIPLKVKLLNLAQLNASTPLAFSWTDRLRFLRRMADETPALAERSAMQQVAFLTRTRDLRWHP